MVMFWIRPVRMISPLVAIACLLAIPACAAEAPGPLSPSTGAADTPGAAIPTGGTPLEWLDLVPADVTDVWFTDWRAIRSSEGLTEPADHVRDDMYLALLDRHAAVSWFAGPQRTSHLEAWGFDAANLSWELSMTTPDGSLIHVLSFDDAFGWEDLMARFDERDYAAEPHGDAVVRTVERDLFVDWQAASDSAMLNVATVDATRLLFASDESESIEAVLATMEGAAPAVAGVELVVETAAKLEGALSGSLVMGEGRCAQRGISVLPPELTDESFSGLGPWEVLGSGYVLEEEEPRLRVALTFADAGTARADLSPRVLLVNGYASLYDTVVLASAEVIDRTSVFEMGLTGGLQPELISLTADGGVLYDGCL